MPVAIIATRQLLPYPVRADALATGAVNPQTVDRVRE